MIDRDTPIVRRWANMFSDRNYRFNGWRWLGLIATIVIIGYALLSSATHPRSTTDALQDRLVTQRVSAGKR